MTWRCRLDRGSATVELAIVAPVLIAFMLLVVYAGRVADADANVHRAASEAARAASLRQHPAEATEVARETAAANLHASGAPCISLATDVNASEFRAGGVVTVTVTCVASMRDVAFLGVPGTRTFRARAVETVDTYRGGEP